MKRKSIITRLFMITAAVFVAFLLTEIALQSIFFKEFYEYKKIADTKEKMHSFISEYEKLSWDQNQVCTEIRQLMEKSDTPFMITDIKGQPYYSEIYGIGPYELIVADNIGGLITIEIDDTAKESLQNYTPVLGDDINVQGIELTSGYLEPISITAKDKTFSVDLDLSDDTLTMGKVQGDYPEIEDFCIEQDLGDSISILKDMQMLSTEGKIVYINDPEEDIPYDYKVDLLFNEAAKWIAGKQNQNTKASADMSKEYSFYDDLSGNKNVVMVEPIKMKGDKPGYVFALVSLQPVDEAIDVMKDYYIYIFLLVLACILILSYIYSRIIARPLLEINDTALRMADMDFSSRCKIDSEDELGSLASSLNVMAQRLDESLQELRTANEKLLDDIEKEKQQEMIRREFVASVSHELKTPLGIIKGFSEGIKDGIYEEKRDHYLDVILDEVDKMDNLVIEMLEVSRLESKGLKLEKTCFALDELLEEAAEKFTCLIHEKDIKIDLQLLPCQVFADHQRIAQVLDNLLSNAIRYSDDDAQVNVSLADTATSVNVYIENTGTHIPEDELGKIWNRFYRIEKSRNRASGGTGLGLLIVKNILEMHNSDFGVHNTETGVEFYFSLPKPVA